MAPSEALPSGLQLPLGVVGKMDAGRLVREAEALENFLRQAEIRTPGTALQMPKTSRLMDELITQNGLNPLHAPDRLQIKQFLSDVYHKAPIMHMSFAVDPSPMFTRKLMAVLRQDIHPHVLVQIGMQPDIGAGCLIRTDSMYFDLSLQNRFAKRREELANVLRTAASFEASTTAVVSEPTAPLPEVAT